MAARLRSPFVSLHLRLAVVLAAVAAYSTPTPTQAPAPTRYGIIDVGLSGGTSVANDVSEFGYAIVGQARTASGAMHAYSDGILGRKDLGTLGGADSTAFAVWGNSVVGQAKLANGQDRAFLIDLWQGTTLTNLGTLGGTWSAAYGVVSDIVVGGSRVAGDARIQAFKYENGTMTAVPINRGGDSVARGVNTSGDIVGYACAAGNAQCRAFVVRGGVATDLGSLGGTSAANGINESGVIVGTSYISGTVRRAFRYAGGAMQDLGTLGGQRSEGLAINDRGEIVGRAQTSSGVWRPFIWRNGVMTDLTTLVQGATGWVLQTATSISEGGQITGVGTLNGVTRGFLLTPAVDLALTPGGVRSQSDSNLPRGVEVGRTIGWTTSLQAFDDHNGITVYRTRVIHTLTGPAEFISARVDNDGSCQLAPTTVTCDIPWVDTPGIGQEMTLAARTTGSGAITHSVRMESHVPDTGSTNNTVVENNRAVALSTFTITPTSVAGGKAAVAHVTLTMDAPNGDAVMRVSSSNPAVVPLPSTWVVPVWALRTREFNIIPNTVSTPTPVDITLTYGQVTITRRLTVLPAALTQLYLTPTTVVGGCGTSAGRVTISGAAPSGGAIVQLTNTNTRASVPTQVTVPAGAFSQTFTVTTSAVTTTSSGDVTASYGGVSQTLRLTVRPIRASSIGLTPNPVRGGQTVSGTVTLECPAAPGNVVVSLSSGNPGVAAPTVSSITIPAGARTGTFTVRTSAVTANTAVNIYATVFGTRKGAPLTVTP